MQTPAGPSLPSYALVTPVRDEAEYFARTAESVLAQTHRPQQWAIVDDGSTDGTREVAQGYADAHDWITLLDSPGHDHVRARGAPIVRAFNRGRGALRARPDITVKLDGDLFLPSHYFEWVAHTFAEAPRAGIVGGTVLIPGATGWVPDGRNVHNVNGVAKAYRTSCLEDIGGLPESMGWDGIDEYAARARGWKVMVLTELTLLHYRPRGSKQPWYRARWEEGRGNHFMGYRWQFLLVRAGYRMLVERPPVLGGLALAAGYVYAAATGGAQIADAGARAALREEQRTRLRRMLIGRRDVPRPPLSSSGPAYSATGCARRSTTDR